MITKISRWLDSGANHWDRDYHREAALGNLVTVLVSYHTVADTSGKGIKTTVFSSLQSTSTLKMQNKTKNIGPDASIPRVRVHQVWKHRSMRYCQEQRHQINHTGSLTGWNSDSVSENAFPMWEPPVQGGRRSRTQEACTSEAHNTIKTRREASKFHALAL